MPSRSNSVDLKAALENKGLTFHIKAGGAKYQATLTDRAT